MQNNFVLKKEIFDLLAKHHAPVCSVFDYSNFSALQEKDIPFFKNWIASQAHGEMTYLSQNIDVRSDVTKVLPEVKSALIFLFPYDAGQRVRRKKHGQNTTIGIENSIVRKNLVARYARGKDYHRVLKQKLNGIAQDLSTHFSTSFHYRPVVDSIPFLERAHAREAGIGFIGKNTLLIRPGLGSYFFIASLLTSLDAAYFTEISQKKNPILSLDCGDCKRCLEACPTQAFQEPYFLDAKKCLSYFTIEHRDIVDEKYLPHFAETIYGCDVCQAVCPYNLVTDDVVKIKEICESHAPFLEISVQDIAHMDRPHYEKWFGGTAATRAKYGGLVRNALYHLYACKDPSLSSVLQFREQDADPLIRKTVEQLKKLCLSS